MWRCLLFSKNHIDVVVGHEEGPWRFTGVYGVPEQPQRWRTWRMLDYLVGVNSLPWMCLGDFNEVLFDYEKVGGNARRERSMSDFRDCLDRCGLCDLGFVGHMFT